MDLCDIEILMKYMINHGFDELTVGDVRLVKRRASWNMDQKEQTKKNKIMNWKLFFGQRAMA